VRRGALLHLHLSLLPLLSRQQGRGQRRACLAAFSWLLEHRNDSRSHGITFLIQVQIGIGDGFTVQPHGRCNHGDDISSPLGADLGSEAWGSRRIDTVICGSIGKHAVVPASVKMDLTAMSV
jgi:hypothetical protein